MNATQVEANECEMDWTPVLGGHVIDVPCGEPSELTAEIDGVTYTPDLPKKEALTKNQEPLVSA